jgi:ankyrin repeat protein
MAILLLTYGANINATDSSGCLAIHYAILSEDRPMFDMLLEKGVNMNAVDKVRMECCWRGSQETRFYTMLVGWTELEWQPV